MSEFKRAARFEPTWRSAVVVAIGIVVLWSFIASRSTLFDRDEPRFAQAAVEMLDSGNYLFPTFNGHLRPEKPILIYWFMVLGMKMFGHTELAVRFWSGAGIAGAALFTNYIGTKLFNRRTGLYAMIGVAMTPLAMLIGSWATADGVLLCCICGAMAGFTRMITRPSNKIHWSDILAIGVPIGFAQLEKGPVGLAVPVLGMVMALRLMKKKHDPMPKAGWMIAGAVVVSIVMFFAWAIPANNATHGEFGRLGLIKNVWDRMFAPQEDHGGSGMLGYLALLPVYVPIVIGGFFPWTLYLFGAAWALKGQRIGDARGRGLIIGWIVPTFILMSLIATKLPHYILPIFPALSLMVAATIDRFQEGKLDERDELLLHRGGILFFPVAVGFSLVMLISPWFLGVGELRTPMVVLGVLMAVMTYVALREHLNWRFERSAAVVAIGMVVAGIYVATFILPGIELMKVSPGLAKMINEATDAKTPVTTCGYDEPSLFYYLNRPPIESTYMDELPTWAGKGSAGVLVIPRGMLEEARERYPGMVLQEIGTSHGMNYNKGVNPIEVVAVVRGPGTGTRGK